MWVLLRAQMETFARAAWAGENSTLAMPGNGKSRRCSLNIGSRMPLRWSARERCLERRTLRKNETEVTIAECSPDAGLRRNVEPPAVCSGQIIDIAHHKHNTI